MDMVSIVVLANGEPQPLARTLESLLRQNYSDTEIIVADLLSADAAFPHLVDQYARQVRYLALPPQSRPGVRLNAAAQLARGTYITFLQAGTVVSPTWLSVAVRALTHSPGSWCYTAARIRGTEASLPPRDWQDFKKEGNIFPDLITGWGVSPQSVVMTREQLCQLDGFDEDLTALTEEEFLLRLAQDFPAQYSHTSMLEIQRPERSSPQALVSRCYFMSAFLAPLGRLGLKGEVLEKLLEDVDDAGAWDTVKDYLDILNGDPAYRACLQAYRERKYPRREIVLSDAPNVSGVKDCVGCGSCCGSCPEGAVTMAYGKEGFLHPQVDETLCTQCGLCLAACPTQQTLPDAPAPHAYLAAQAADDVRAEASSGGVFPLLAQHILRDGGYVAGAVFDGDFSAVRHIVSNKPEDILAMRTSKYLQSSTVDVYPQVRLLLEQGRTVLFSGTACQVAGLLAFLRKPYDNLYTVDVVCHGVPSPGVYAHYLKEFQRPGDPIVEVNFRKKETFGWSAGFYIRYASGKVYAPTQTDLYTLCFLSNWILRESCYHCAFKGMKYSDLTIADFWGIQQLDRQFQDGKGTSLLTINTERGQRLYQLIESDLIKSRPFGREIEELLHLANPNIWDSVRRPSFRDLFFKYWQEAPGSLSNVLTQAFCSLHFDIGLVLFWGPNHGNALTNYALYKSLAKKRSVLAIDNVLTAPPGRFRDFANRNYVCSSDYFPANAPKLIAERCDTLLVGSDQLWNVQFSPNGSKYYQLDFAGDNVRKIAYGASFGARELAPPAEGYSQLYRRFDKIGVREKFGVDICRDRYGADADFVLDPVFLLDTSDYDALADQSTQNETEPFIFSYIFYPNPQFMEFRKKLQRNLGNIKIISATQANWEDRDDLRHAFEFENVRQGTTVEDWLYYIKHARFVITDSFHATCFSLFFRKEFAAIPHAVSDRFTTLYQFGDTRSHISTQLTDAFLDKCLKPLDYDRIHADLDRERKRSRKWLEDALR